LKKIIFLCSAILLILFFSLSSRGNETSIKDAGDFNKNLEAQEALENKCLDDPDICSKNEALAKQIVTGNKNIENAINDIMKECFSNPGACYNNDMLIGQVREANRHAARKHAKSYREMQKPRLKFLAAKTGKRADKDAALYKNFDEFVKISRDRALKMESMKKSTGKDTDSIAVESTFIDIPSCAFKPCYGNWCGRGDKKKEPIDELDAACRDHDKCYESMGKSGCWKSFGKGTSSCERQCHECDEKLIEDAKRISKESAGGSKAESAKMISDFFKLKCKIVFCM
jgi:hypothetical protein